MPPPAKPGFGACSPSAPQAASSTPKTARSQVIGGMTMGVGAALMEELAVDPRLGLFVNHDLAGYEVPVHADIPHQEVIFLDETDPVSSPMKAKGVGELGICGAAAAVANAVYNATGVRVRDYPITLDKLLSRLPSPVPDDFPQYAKAVERMDEALMVLDASASRPHTITAAEGS